MLVLSLVVAGLLALAVTRDQAPEARDTTGGGAGAEGTALPPRESALDAADYLDTYVEGDGRVVRLDQGGDTVSEGQAYGMLIAVLADDRDRFDAIWQWTREHLERDDGLFSWRWDDGAVVDPSSASDAEVDMARALLLAADAFDDRAYAATAVELGGAILRHQTVRTDDGLVLVAGEWATGTPAWFNPSYVSPVTTQLLTEETGDPRWAELERGSRAAVEAVSTATQLPPNWAGIDDQGQVYPQPSPDGTQVEYGYDAARTLLRHAESCRPADREIAARATDVITRNDANAEGRIVSVYDLGGAPLTEAAGPLGAVAQAAGHAAGGSRSQAEAALDQAAEQQQAAPTYYGDAWAVLGPAMVGDDRLGGCPPLEDLR